MAPEVPVGEPQLLTAGETWRWTVVAPEFPHADGWTLTYHLIGPSGGTIPTTPEPGPTTYLAELGAATTAAIAAGIYQWILRADDGAGEVFQVDKGVFTVQPDPATAADEPLFEERMLAAIEAVLEGRIPKDVESYTIHNRQLDKIPIRELQRLRSEYAHAVWVRRNPGQANPARKVVFGGV